MTNRARCLYERLVITLTEPRFLRAARELYNHDDGWLSDFCSDCQALEIHGATGPSYSCGGEPGYETCPAELNPLDCECVRNDILFEDERVIERALENLSEDFFDENEEVA